LERRGGEEKWRILMEIENEEEGLCCVLLLCVTGEILKSGG
jgi:hypothetical protein